MRKLHYLLPALLLLASCSTDRQVMAVGQGAMIGGMLGSSIGGLMGGWRGSHAGQAVGIIAGAVIGHAATTPRQSPSSSPSDANKTPNNQPDKAYSYEPEIYDSPQSPAGTRVYSQATTEMQELLIEDLAFFEDHYNGYIDADETCQIQFIIHNRSRTTLYDLSPIISATPDKVVRISPTMRISRIAPGQKVRYTAFVKAKRNIKAKEIHFGIALQKDNRIYDRQSFTIPTERAR